MASKPSTKPPEASAEEPALEEESFDFADLDARDERAATELMKELAGKDRQLHRKLADIMVIAQRIPKRGRADRAMGGYSFVQVGDAADFIRKALGRRHVSMQPTNVEVVGRHDHPTARGGIMTILDMTVVWTLTDGDTDEKTTIMTFGAGGDTGDKYSGKAMTSNMKYSFLAGFQLSTGEDTELSDASDRVAQPSERPQGPNTTGQRPAPQHGGRQQSATEPQSKVIGDLLRQLGARTSDAAIEVIQRLTGKTIEAGDDKAAALSKFISGDALSSNERGKLIHDLRKEVEAKNDGGQAAETKTDTEETAAAAGDSSPGAPAGDAPDQSLEADQEA